ncbi:MAG: hypothetical protein MK212_12265 [Saprospiraceae bacterium]|nr:hypothetical protein [Saprospiraceae bacterium]
MDINQLEIDDLQDIGKYMFSIANGNHLLPYSEVEYRDFLATSPNVIIDLLIIYFVSSNWGYDDPRMFENYDEQWLAMQIDPTFTSVLDFSLPDFQYSNLRPYQQVVIDFTQALIVEAEHFSLLLQTGTPIERIYAVLACNMDIDVQENFVKNKDHAIGRALEMYRCIFVKDYNLAQAFETWELVIY